MHTYNVIIPNPQLMLARSLPKGGIMISVVDGVNNAADCVVSFKDSAVCECLKQLLAPFCGHVHRPKSLVDMLSGVGEPLSVSVFFDREWSDTLSNQQLTQYLSEVWPQHSDVEWLR
jgi:hypothetical protein